MPYRPALIIDDDLELSVCLADMIRGLGYEVVRAANGLEALAMLRQIEPSLMLVDLFMPGMGGIEFLHLIKLDPRLSAIPKVIMTAANDQMVGVKEDVSVLYKPIEIEVLAQVLEQHCGVAEGPHREIAVRGSDDSSPAHLAVPEAPALPTGLADPSLARGGTAVAHNSSKPADRNWKPADAASNSDDSWKTRPSSETTSDEGKNAKRTREHQQDENAPRRAPTKRQAE